MNTNIDFDMFENNVDVYEHQSSSGYTFEKFTDEYPGYLDSLNNYITLIYNTYILIHNKRRIKIKKYPDCLEIAQRCGFGMLMRHALETISTSIATENGVEVGGRSVYERLNVIKTQKISGYDDKKKKVLFDLLDLTNEISHPHVLHSKVTTFAQLQSFYNTSFKRILESYIIYINDLIKNSRTADFGITREVLKSRKQAYKYLSTLHKYLTDFNIFNKTTNILIQGCLVRQLTECTVNLWAYNYNIVPTDVSTAENQINLSKVLGTLAQIARSGKKTAFGSSALTNHVVTCLYELKDASNSLMHVEKFATGDLSKKGENLSNLYNTIKTECSPHVMKKKLSEAADISKAPRKKIREKSSVVASLLCGLLGWVGAHHFYVGSIFKGVVYILFGGFIIGPTLDLYKLLNGRFRDAKGFRVRRTQLSSVVALILLLAHLFLWYSIGVKLYENGIFDKIKNFDLVEIFTVQRCADGKLAELDRIAVTQCTASSHLTTGENSFEPYLSVDGNPYTCWQEGAAWNGEGESITFNFTGEESISAISILNGKHTDQNAYYNNARAQRVIIQIGYMRYFMNFDDTMQRHTFAFDSPKKASEVKITIDSAYAGNVWQDLCISEIEFYKERADGQ